MNAVSQAIRASGIGEAERVASSLMALSRISHRAACRVHTIRCAAERGLQLTWGEIEAMERAIDRARPAFEVPGMGRHWLIVKHAGVRILTLYDCDLGCIVTVCRNKGRRHEKHEFRHDHRADPRRDEDGDAAFRLVAPETGARIMACEKCMGLGKGGKVVKIRPIEILSTREEPAAAIALYHDLDDELAREGFPGMSASDFVGMLCRRTGARSPIPLIGSSSAICPLQPPGKPAPLTP